MNDILFPPYIIIMMTATALQWPQMLSAGDEKGAAFSLYRKKHGIKNLVDSLV